MSGAVRALTPALVLEALTEAFRNVVEDGTKCRKVCIDHIVAGPKRTNSLVPCGRARHQLSVGDMIADTTNAYKEDLGATSLQRIGPVATDSDVTSIARTDLMKMSIEY